MDDRLFKHFNAVEKALDDLRQEVRRLRDENFMLKRKDPDGKLRDLLTRLLNDREVYQWAPCHMIAEARELGIEVKPQPITHDFGGHS